MIVIHLLKRIVVALMLILAVFNSKSADKPLKVEKDDGRGSAYSDEYRLFDDKDKFVKTVWSNLNVPNENDIICNVEEPKYEEVYELETVQVTFYQGGEIVAAARCATSDGSLVSSIMMYSKPEETDAENVPIEEPAEEAPVEEVPVEEVPVEEVPAEEEDVTYDSSPQYLEYKNARFGYIINYPDFLIPGKESQNGDGRTFSSTDGKIKLTTWGSFFPTISEEMGTIDGFYDYVLSNLEYEPTYTAKKSTYFVFTGYLGDNIVYEKYFLKSDKVECAFRIEYPAYLREDLYDVVTHIANTMAVGAGYDSPVER